MKQFPDYHGGSCQYGCNEDVAPCYYCVVTENNKLRSYVAGIKNPAAIPAMIEAAKNLEDCHCDHHESPDYGVCTYTIKRALAALDQEPGGEVEP